jgi:phage repressor protein C with HTH and peptisase S24 domain
MFTHAQMWSGIDQLARHHGLTASGLARKAGLDPTTFNPSKRITKQAKPRWPSTESLAKVLAATGTPFPEFVTMMGGAVNVAPSRPQQRLPCIAFDQADRDGRFDDAGYPIGADWDEVEFPNLTDRHAYALEVRGNGMAPMFRDGDLLIVSPDADVRRHDRIVIKLRSGAVLAGVMLRRTAQRLEIAAFGGADERHSVTLNEAEWLARIVWVSQ